MTPVRQWIMSGGLTTLLLLAGACSSGSPTSAEFPTITALTANSIATAPQAATPTVQSRSDLSATMLTETPVASVETTVPKQEAPPAASATPSQEPDPSSEGYAPGEVVVKLRAGADLAALAAAYALDPTPIDQFGSRPIYWMRILDAASPVQRAVELQADPAVEYAEPNFTVQPPEWRSQYSWAKSDDSSSGTNQWADDTLRLAEAHAMSTGVGVIVAVLDTGVDTSHPDLAGRFVAGWDFVDGDNDPSEVESAAAGSSPYGHGTHVADSVALVAPDARIMPVRVLDPDGRGNIWVLAEAIAWAADPDGNPTTPDGAQVINLSLSTPRRTSLLDEVVRAVTCVDLPESPVDDGDDDDDDDDDDGDDGDDGDDDGDEGDNDEGGGENDTITRTLAQQDEQATCETIGTGVVVTAAAGNRGSDAPEYPAAEEIAGLLAVAASTRDDQISPTSSIGAWVDVAAPGVDIISTMPAGEYAAWSGTSMASALAAGHAALVRSIEPMLRPEDVVERIVTTASAMDGQTLPRIDIVASLTAPS